MMDEEVREQQKARILEEFDLEASRDQDLDDDVKAKMRQKYEEQIDKWTHNYDLKSFPSNYQELRGPVRNHLNSMKSAKELYPSMVEETTVDDVLKNL